MPAERISYNTMVCERDHSHLDPAPYGAKEARRVDYSNLMQRLGVMRRRELRRLLQMVSQTPHCGHRHTAEVDDREDRGDGNIARWRDDARNGRDV